MLVIAAHVLALFPPRRLKEDVLTDNRIYNEVLPQRPSFFSSSIHHSYKQKKMAPLQNQSSKKTSTTLSSSSKPRSKAKALKSGRPPLLSSSKSMPASAFNPQRSSLSSRRTRTLIRTHHVLQKRLAQARADNDTEQIHELEAQLAASGGLETYQLASTVGQSAERGGDSSRVLVDWLRSAIEARRPKAKTVAASSRSPSDTVQSSARTWRGQDGHSQPSTTTPITNSGPPPLRILEIGALSTTNALNMPLVTKVRRIDLRSSGPGIEEADFMKFPLPNSPDRSGEWEGGRGYDVISLSLVLNYVPDARGRGEMLRRTTMFFSTSDHDDHDDHDSYHMEEDEQGKDHAHTNQNQDQCTKIKSKNDNSKGDEDQRKTPRPRRLVPCLFLVLPAPTLHNSRYLTPDHLTAILSSLGYSHLETKTTRKLHYSLWRYDPRRRAEWIAHGGKTVFRKKEINPGSGRNNFCIVLEEPEGE